MLRAAAFGFVSVLFAGAIACVGQEHSRAEQAVLRPTLSLEVKTEVRSERAKLGDEVKFKTVQGSIFHGSVIPKSAAVFGRVISAQGREGGNPGMLCVRLERAAWKGGEVQLRGYVMAELVTRLVSIDEFGRKEPVHEFDRKMPDLKLLKSSDGTTTLLRDDNNVVLRPGMKVLGEITDVSSIEARR